MEDLKLRQKIYGFNEQTRQTYCGYISKQWLEFNKIVSEADVHYSRAVIISIGEDSTIRFSSKSEGFSASWKYFTNKEEFIKQYTDSVNEGKRKLFENCIEETAKLESHLKAAIEYPN